MDEAPDERAAVDVAGAGDQSLQGVLPADVVRVQRPVDQPATGKVRLIICNRESEVDHL